MREIEAAGGVECTGIINNTNLGAETTAEIIASSLEYAEEVAAKAGLPVAMTTAKAEFLTDAVKNPVPIEIYVKTLWN